MALTHTTAVRNAMADAVVDSIDAGSTDAAGDLVIMTAGDVEVSTHLQANPAYGGAASGTSTANAIGDDTTAAGGTAALYKQQNRDNTEIMRGTVTVTGGGGDIEISSVAIGAGDTVQISSLTYTASN